MMTEKENNQRLTNLLNANKVVNYDLSRQLLEAQSYKADAERYRWLNDNGCIFWTGVNTDKEVKHQVCEQAMDEVIDQAMKENND